MPFQTIFHYLMRFRKIYKVSVVIMNIMYGSSNANAQTTYKTSFFAKIDGSNPPLLCHNKCTRMYSFTYKVC